MTKRSESYFKTLDKSKIFFQRWEAESSRGQVLITHGLGEHSGSYKHVAHSLNQDHWDVLAWDLRGHGKSSGQPGYASHFDDFTSDFQKWNEILEEGQWVNKDKPLVFFGHSMGGLIMLKYLLNNEAKPALPVSAACLSAPALGLVKKASPLLLWVASLIVKLYPRLTLHNQIQYQKLTNDEKQIKFYEMDALRHNKISPNIYLGMIESFNYIHKCIHGNPTQFNIPMLFQIPEKDTIIDSQRTIDMTKKLNPAMCQVRIYSNSYHEIFNGLEKEVALNDLKAFLATV